MIIQIRGTSGSGKSTVMRKIMNRSEWQGVFVEGRKKPLYYESVDPGLPSVAVVGHYESPCGGGDTIGSAKAIYDLITTRLSSFRVILCEGLLLSEDVKWSSQLPDLKVLYLVTPLEQCLAQIKSRREGVGNDKPVNPKNTANRIEVIERSRVKLLELGVRCVRAAASQAEGIILKWLLLHAQQGDLGGSGTRMVDPC